MTRATSECTKVNWTLSPPHQKNVLLLHFYLQRACCGSETRYVAVRKERVKEAEKIFRYVETEVVEG